MLHPHMQGVPIGAILMKDKVADVIKIGDHGTTFGCVLSASSVSRTLVTGYE